MKSKTVLTQFLLSKWTIEYKDVGEYIQYVCKKLKLKRSYRVGKTFDMLKLAVW